MKTQTEDATAGGENTNWWRPYCWSKPTKYSSTSFANFAYYRVRQGMQKELFARLRLAKNICPGDQVHEDQFKFHTSPRNRWYIKPYRSINRSLVLWRNTEIFKDREVWYFDPTVL